MPVSVQRRTWAFGAGLARAAGGNPLALDPERPSRDLPESDAALNWARTAVLFCSFNGLLVAMFSLVGGGGGAGGDFGGGGRTERWSALLGVSRLDVAVVTACLPLVAANILAVFAAFAAKRRSVCAFYHRVHELLKR